MANAKHLKILKQGVERWNKWRQDEGPCRPDLRSADLNGLYLNGANLSKADLIKAPISQGGRDLWFEQTSDFLAGRQRCV